MRLQEQRRHIVLVCLTTIYIRPQQQTNRCRCFLILRQSRLSLFLTILVWTLADLVENLAVGGEAARVATGGTVVSGELKFRSDLQLSSPYLLIECNMCMDWTAFWYWSCLLPPVSISNNAVLWHLPICTWQTQCGVHRRLLCKRTQLMNVEDVCNAEEHQWHADHFIGSTVTYIASSVLSLPPLGMKDKKATSVTKVSLAHYYFSYHCNAFY